MIKYFKNENLIYVILTVKTAPFMPHFGKQREHGSDSGGPAWGWGQVREFLLLGVHGKSV